VSKEKLMFVDDVGRVLQVMQQAFQGGQQQSDKLMKCDYNVTLIESNKRQKIETTICDNINKMISLMNLKPYLVVYLIERCIMKTFMM
jgi:hypothetical protein